jgi:HSP20 family protein
MDRPENEVEWIKSEIWYGAFERTISLPEGVQTDRISADYRDGVLLITAPLAASALPRRIEIQSGESKRMTMQA